MKFWRGLRWLLASIIVAAVIVGATTGHWKHCEERAAGPATSEKVELCRTASVSDAAIVGALLLVLLLLWPELGELSLPGGLGFKRRLERQEQALSHERRRGDDFERRLSFLQNQQQTAYAGSAANASIVLADPERLLAALEPKERAFAEGQPRPVDKPEADSAPARERRAELEREIIAVWRQLGALIRQAEEVELSTGETNTPKHSVELSRWREAFRRELDVVAAARGAVLSDSDIDTEDLQAAVRLGRRIRDLAPAAPR